MSLVIMMLFLCLGIAVLVIKGMNKIVTIFRHGLWWFNWRLHYWSGKNILNGATICKRIKYTMFSLVSLWCRCFLMGTRCIKYFSNKWYGLIKVVWLPRINHYWLRITQICIIIDSIGDTIQLCWNLCNSEALLILWCRPVNIKFEAKPFL